MQCPGRCYLPRANSIRWQWQHGHCQGHRVCIHQRSRPAALLWALPCRLCPQQRRCSRLEQAGQSDQAILKAAAVTAAPDQPDTSGIAAGAGSKGCCNCHGSKAFGAWPRSRLLCVFCVLWLLPRCVKQLYAGKAHPLDYINASLCCAGRQLQWALYKSCMGVPTCPNCYAVQPHLAVSFFSKLHTCLVCCVCHD